MNIWDAYIYNMWKWHFQKSVPWNWDLQELGEKKTPWDFRDGPVVKTPCFHYTGWGSIPGWESSTCFGVQPKIEKNSIVKKEFGKSWGK